MKTVTIKSGIEISQKKEEEVGKKVLHYAYLLDRSGSMNWRDGFGRTFPSRYETAIKGINNEINELKSQEEVDVRISVFEFDSVKTETERITEHYFNTPLSKITGPIEGTGASGNTPLYQSLAYVIEKYLRYAKNDEPVVINIFTDGEHNCFWGKYGTDKECKALISDVEKNRNFVVTFMGTAKDVEHTIKNLGVERGNTYSYDGSAKGLNQGLKSRVSQTMSFVSNFAQGNADWNNIYNSNTNNGENKVQESTQKSTTPGKSN